MGHQPLSSTNDFKDQDARDNGHCALACTAEQHYREALGVVQEQVQILTESNKLSATISDRLYGLIQLENPHLLKAVQTIVSSLRERAKGNQISLSQNQLERNIEVAGQVECLYHQSRTEQFSLQHEGLPTDTNVSDEMRFSAITQYSLELKETLPHMIEQALKRLPTIKSKDTFTPSFAKINNTLVVPSRAEQIKQVGNDTSSHYIYSLSGYVSLTSPKQGALVLSDDSSVVYDPSQRLAIESAGVPIDPSGRIADLSKELASHLQHFSIASETLADEAFKLSFTRWTQGSTLALPADMKVSKHRFLDDNDRVLSDSEGSVSQDCLGIGHVHWPQEAVCVELELLPDEVRQLSDNLQRKILEYGKYGAVMPGALVDVLQSSNGTRKEKLQIILDYHMTRGCHYVNHPILDDIITIAGTNLQPFLAGGGFGACTHLSYSLASTLNQADIPAIVIGGHYIGQNDRYYTASPGHEQVLCFLPAPVVLDPTIWGIPGSIFYADELKASGIVEKLAEATPEKAYRLGQEATDLCLWTNQLNGGAILGSGHALLDDSSFFQYYTTVGDNRARDKIVRLRIQETIQKLLSGDGNTRELVNQLTDLGEHSYAKHCTEIYFRTRIGKSHSPPATPSEEYELGEALYNAALSFSPSPYQEHLKQELLGKYIDGIRLLFRGKTAHLAYDLLVEFFDHVEENGTYHATASNLLDRLACGHEINVADFPELRKKAISLRVQDFDLEISMMDMKGRHSEVAKMLNSFEGLPPTLKDFADDAFYENFSHTATTPRYWLKYLLPPVPLDEDGTGLLLDYMQRNAQKPLLSPLIDSSGKFTPSALTELGDIARDAYRRIREDSEIASSYSSDQRYYSDTLTLLLDVWCQALHTIETETGQKIPIVRNEEDRCLIEDAIRKAPSTIFRSPATKGRVALLREFYNATQEKDFTEIEFIIFYLIDNGALSEESAMKHWTMKIEESGEDGIEALHEIIEEVLSDLVLQIEEYDYRRICADLITLCSDEFPEVIDHITTLHQYSLRTGHSKQSLFDDLTYNERCAIRKTVLHQIFKPTSGEHLKKTITLNALDFYREQFKHGPDLAYSASLVRLIMKLAHTDVEEDIVEKTLQEQGLDRGIEPEEFSLMTLLCSVESEYRIELDKLLMVGRQVVDIGHFPLDPESDDSVIVNPIRGKFSQRAFTSHSDKLYYYLAAAGCVVALYPSVDDHIEERLQKIADRLVNSPKLIALSRGMKTKSVDTILTGRRSSRSGQEVAELTSYNFGDDLRTVDWKATARGDKVLVKRFEDPDTKRHAKKYTLRVDAMSLLSDAEYPSQALLEIFSYLRTEIHEGRSVELEISYANSMLANWTSNELTSFMRTYPSVFLKELWIYGIAVGAVESELDFHFPERTPQPFARTSSGASQILAGSDEAIARVKESGCDLSKSQVLQVSRSNDKPKIRDVSYHFDSTHQRILDAALSRVAHRSPLKDQYEKTDK